MSATIKDVAREAGVSASTVSLVLNKRNCRVAPETRERILAAAKNLHYSPNRLAVSLITKSSNTIGLGIPDIGNAFVAQLCKGCEAEARRHGYNIILGSSGERISHDEEYIGAFIDTRVDGIVYMQSSANDPDAGDRIRRRVASAGTPLVSVDRRFPLDGSLSVLFDNRLGGCIATQHLLRLGHRRIGCLTGPRRFHDVSTQRLEGYRDALREAEIPFDESLVVEGDYSIESGASCLPYMRGNGATAIFCFNDMMALGVYKAMRIARLEIPRDMSIVGHDDIAMSEVLEVPLTTVHQPAYDIGKAAVTQLIRLMSREAGLQDIVFAPYLKLRASTGPCGSARDT